MKKRALSLLPVLALVIALLSGLTLSASADDILPISGDHTITQDGIYQLEEGISADIIISEGVGNVTIIGNGAEWSSDLSDLSTFGAVTSTANDDILIDCTAAPGITLTLKDLYVNNSFVGHNLVNFSGENNTLIFDGTVILDHDNNVQGWAGIHVPKGTELTVYGTTGSSLYMYKREQAAGIGANNGESCGTINFGLENGANDFYFYMKGTKQGAVIGNGANCSETPGDITFYSGVYNLIANARGALIGGSAGASSFDAGNVYIKGGLLNLNVDYSGAAIGGGGYESGNDKLGGNVYITGGSVRTYIDTNAASLWASYGVTEAGVNDAAITANKLAEDGVPVSIVPIDTAEIPADENGNYTILVNGETYYSGPRYSYCFCYENIDRDLSNDVYPNGTPGNWIPLTSETQFYIYLPAGEHHIVVNGVELAGHSYGENGFCTYCEAYDPEAESYTVSTAGQLAAIADAVNGGDTLAGKTVTLANDLSLSVYANWTPIGGAATRVDLTLESQEDLNTALQEHFIIYDNTGASYVRNSDKNGAYDPSRTYYYQLGAAFGGTFDGAGHTVSDLTVDTTEGYAGLFGNVDGTVKNLTVSGTVTSTTTMDFVGGVAGKLSAGGLIENCVSNVDVTAASAFNIGGVVGLVGEPGLFVSEDNPIATVLNCVNNGYVYGYVRTGGIAGRNAGRITGCVNHGTVFNGSAAKKGTGGIVGMNGVNNFPVADAGIVEFCYNDGYVDSNGGYWTGGIVGFQNGASSCTNSYNAGTLKVAATAAGTLWSWINPIVGQNEGTVTDCLWLNVDSGDNTANYIGKDPSGVGQAAGTVTNVEGVSEAELRSLEAVAFLNCGAEQGFQSDCGSYPALYWQSVTAHTSETDAAVAPSCTEEGLSEGSHCSVCGAVLVTQEIVSAAGHIPAADAAVPPTCTETGLTEGSHCAVCGEILTVQDTVPALGHTYEKTVTAPTCTAEGYSQYTCTVCGQNYREDFIPALGHTYEETTVAPTCTTEGYTQYTCTVCGDSYRGDFAAALGHTYEDTVTAPDCDKMGYTTHTCTVCAYSYIDSYTEALDHSYQQEMTKEPTCAETGEMTFTCTECGKSYTQTLPKAEHTLKEVVIAPGCESYGYTAQQCEICGYSYVTQIVQPLGHSTTLRNAAESDCTTDGYTGDLVCERCGKTVEYGKAIPADCPSAPFADVSTGAWYHEAVDFALEAGLMKGVAANLFAPNGEFTRGMMVTVLYRLAGEPDTEGMENPFADVGDTWYTEAVIWAANNDVVNGVSKTEFAPDKAMTREEMVTMLCRYAAKNGVDTTAKADLSAFADGQQVSSWAREAMQWAVERALIAGVGDERIDPDGTATRAQIATVFMRYLEQLG